MSTANRTRPPLGAMLIRKGLVSEDELDGALVEHERSGKPLGEVLVERGLVAGPTIADMLLLQNTWRPLGQLLVERRVITDEQLEDALDEHERTGRPLGEIVRKRFFVSAALLGEVIAEQHELELELELGFGSGLRRGITARHHMTRGQAEAGADPGRSSALTARLGPLASARAENDRIAALQAALETREETIAALGSANRKRGVEIEALRATLGERDALITELERRIAELEAALGGPSALLRGETA